MDSLLIYAYLDKQLDFPDMFESIINNVSFQGVDVQALGVNDFNDRNARVKDQVGIYDYKSDDDFILKLRFTNAEDELILAKIKPANTLSDTVAGVEKRLTYSWPEQLQKHDTLAVPKFAFNISANYPELSNKKLPNSGWEAYSIGAAHQDIRFGLSEYGVVLKSGADAIVSSGISTTKPKKLVINQPFLLYLKEKGPREPYFAMWIENPELMVKADKAK